MESDTIEHQPPSGLCRMLLKLPLVAHYRRVRGLSYVISWLHRLTGVALVGFCFFHVLTLQSLNNPAVYDAKMRIFSQPLFTVLEWGLSFPVMFHVLNGGRLKTLRKGVNIVSHPQSWKNTSRPRAVSIAFAVPPPVSAPTEGSWGPTQYWRVPCG